MFRVTLGVETQEDVAMKDHFLREVRRKYLNSVSRAVSVARQPPRSSAAPPRSQEVDVVTPEGLRRQDEETTTEEAGACQEEESGHRSALSKYNSVHLGARYRLKLKDVAMRQQTRFL